MKLVANVRRVSGHCRKRFQSHRITFLEILGRNHTMTRTVLTAVSLFEVVRVNARQPSDY